MTVYAGPLGNPKGIPKDAVPVGYVPDTNIRVYRAPDGKMHIEDNAVLPT